MSKGWVIGMVSILALAGFITWVFIQSSKQLPGQKITALDRKHVPAGTKVDYNSDPPTSGPHYGDWIRAGILETPPDDRNLVHSLEHGYVILSYRCNLTKGESAATSSGESSPSGLLDTKEQCQERKSQLSKIYEKKGKRKLIVTPRTNLDTAFALTAWTYLDKFNDFDTKKIEKFIDSFRDQGPERTVE